MKCYISLIQFRNIEKSFLLLTSDYSLKLTMAHCNSLRCFSSKWLNQIYPQVQKFHLLPQKEKKKKMTPVSKICTKARVEQFPDDFYAEDMLFCKFCLHSVDIFRVDTKTILSQKFI